MRLSVFWILSTLFLFLSVESVTGQVVAGFTASPAAGCAPLVVAFTNTSTPSSGTTYTWNMGNGSGPITLTDPGASYLTAGTYTVTLTASNSGFTSTYSRVITVYPSPVVQFSVNDTMVCPGTTVTFTNTTLAGVPGPVSYLWSSGDGYTSTNATFVHTYSLPGNFNVTLNATNANGCVSTLTKTSYVDVLAPPVAAFGANTRLVCNPSGAVSFFDSSTGTGPFTYRWTFGDGSPPSTLANPSHFYASPGRYTVELIITNADGCKDTIVMPGYINVSRLVAAFTGPDSACVNTTVTFMNTSTGHTSSYWTYGDGHSSYGNHGSNVYLSRGAFSVRLVVADSFCSDTVSRIFSVPNPSVSFHITPDSPCPAPVLATFVANVPPGSTVLWRFGDSTTGTGVNTTHTYLYNKYDTIQMIVTNAIGCKDTVSQWYNIHDLFIALEYPPLYLKGGCIYDTTIFNVTAKTSLPPPAPSTDYNQYPYQPVLYHFDFGDGTFFDTTYLSRSPNDYCALKHVYTAVGVYPVVITVTTPNGCVESITDTIRAGTPHPATFTATPRHQCYNKNLIIFTRAIVTPPIERYYWLFGDHSSDFYDTVSEDPHVVFHHFSLPGIFSDTLISYSNGCPDTFIRKDYIIIDSPRAIPYAKIACNLANTVSFTGTYSIGADTYTWLFGDGSSSTLANPTHTYPVAAQYTATLTVYNIASGCHDTDEIQVDVLRPVITISTADTALCKGDSIEIWPTIVPMRMFHYTWYTPGVAEELHNDHLKVRFPVPGRYTIRLIIEDPVSLCKDTLTKTDYILVSKPDAHFKATTTGICAPQTVVFTDSTTAWPGTFITNYSWAFGDGGTASSGPSVTHTYVTAGTFNITEAVVDNIGCTDTVSLPLVSVYKPTASFTISANNICAPNAIAFTNTSTSPAVYKWSFGDGQISSLRNPTHIYTDSGRFTVKLVVTDSRGCKDSVTYPNLISVFKPSASFYMVDSVSVCPPFTARFTNTSSGGISNYWIFGNGNTSGLANPTNIYSVPGYDTVNLIVTDIRGCRDTATGHVKVYGYAGAFSYSADSGCTPLSIFFDADLSNVSLASTITWDFADGITSTGALSDTISHTYLVPGGYLPKLIISDHVGCVSSSSGIDTIKANGVVPGFRAMPNPVCIRNPVTLTDTSSSYWSDIRAWHWAYDGDTSILASASVIYSVSGTYAVVLRVTDGWGCTAADTENVAVYELPDITSLPDSIICTGGATVLHDSAAGGIWSSGNSAIATVGAGTGVVTGVTAGAVSITYTVGGTCNTTTMVTVNSFPDPGVITGDDGVCLGDSIMVTDTVTGGAWSTRTGKAVVTAGGVLTGLTAGIDTIVYTVTNINCPAAARKIITVYPLPDPGVITGQNAICRDVMTALAGSIPGGKWSTGDTTVATIDSNTGVVQSISLGTATLTYTIPPDINGCINFVTFPLAVINPDFTISSSIDPVRCYGSADGSIAVAVNGGAPPFQFLWSTGSTFSLADHLAAGVYSIVVLETRKQCALADTFQVTSPDSLSASSEVDNDVCNKPNGRINLTAAGGTGPYQFLWSNDATGNEISGLARGTYKCTLTDIKGCQMTVLIIVEDSTCPEIIIYNAISPNGDGLNDTWIIEGLEHFPGSTVAVFDKFGDKVFEKTDYRNDWDGSGKKSTIPDGTYYYLVKLNSDEAPGGRDTFTGSLLIKR